MSRTATSDVSADTSARDAAEAGGTTSFVLGIDPGASTGLAGYAPSAGPRQRGRLVFVTSAGPLPTCRLIAAWRRAGLVLSAVVEDSRSLPVYARHAGKGRGERDRVARSVGRIDCLTELYLDLLRSLSVPARCVEPVREAKWDAAALRRLTGFEGPTNQHGRDAARLVWTDVGPVGPSAPHRRGAEGSGRAVRQR